MSEMWSKHYETHTSDSSTLYTRLTISAIPVRGPTPYLDGRLLVDALVLEVLALLQDVGGLLQLSGPRQLGGHLLLGPVQPRRQLAHLGITAHSHTPTQVTDTTQSPDTGLSFQNSDGLGSELRSYLILESAI